MAEIIDNSTIGGFSIENTMDMGMGNQELLSGLFEPETATASSENLEEIVKEIKPTTLPEKPEVSKGKEIVPKLDGEDLDTQSLVSNFLGNDDDEDDDLIVNKTENNLNTEDSDLDDKEVSKFTALSNDLFKLGVFNKEEDEDDIVINTPEEFLERFNTEKKKGAIETVNNFIGQFGEDYQNAFDAIFVKGVNPKEYFGTYNQVVNFAEMDLSDEGNQVSIMKKALADQGFEPEDIGTEVERLKNYGDLESVAAKHHKVLVKKEAAKLQQMEAKSEQELQQKQAVRNQYISNVQTILSDKVKSKEFDGIPINPKLATELQDFLLVDKWKTPTGETLTDFDRAILDLKRPENHAQKVKIGLLLKMLEKDPTLSTIQRTGVTKKSNELFGEVARQVTKAKSTGAAGGGANSKSWFL